MSAKVPKANAIHSLIFIAIMFAVAFVMQTTVIDQVIKGFVLSQFAPHGSNKTLVTFADGVVATAKTDNTDSDQARQLTVRDENGNADVISYSKRDGHWVTDRVLRGEYIDKEFIFDFSGALRQEKISNPNDPSKTIEADGYSKAKVEYGVLGEWYVQAPALGEHAIILEPWGFSILSFVIGFLVATLVTLIMPPAIGFIAQKIAREIASTKAKVRLQTGFSAEIVEVLSMRDSDLERKYEEDPEYMKRTFNAVWDRTVPEEENTRGGHKNPFVSSYDVKTAEEALIFRNQILIGRIKEFFSDSVATELINIRSALSWRKNQLRIFSALRLYMVHHFTEKYSNTTTGFAYGGAALLIIAVGIRGLKFIPAAKPSLILFAILMEFSLLALLAVTIFYTEGEERMDKMLKKMEDASRNQLDSLDRLAVDMHKFSIAMESGMSEVMKERIHKAVGEYLTENKNVESAVAKAVGDKIMVSLRESFNQPRTPETTTKN